MIARAFLCFVALVIAGPVYAQTGCVPNPNDSGPPLVDGCRISAVGVNKILPVAGSGGRLLGLDQASGAFGAVPFMVGTGGLVTGGNSSSAALNAIVGETTNNISPATLSFPTGVTGAGFENTQGNQAFGLFGLGELHSTTGGDAVGAEFTARNFSGNNPDTSIPPNTAIGTTTSVAIGENVTCGVAVGTKDCSIGIILGNESGSYSNSAFNTGVLLSIFRQTGLWISGQSSGNQISARIDNNGTGINLQLGTTQTISPNNGVISVIDSVGATHFSVRQIGDIYSTGKLELSQASRPTLSANCNGAGSGVNHSTDQAGIITTPTAGATSGQCTVNFAGASPFQNIPSCVVIGENVAGLSIVAKGLTSFTVGGLSSSAQQNFDYHCLDQQ